MGGDNPFGAKSEFEKSDGTMARFMDLHSLEERGLCKLDDIPSVSYTHLTLPTKA